MSEEEAHHPESPRRSARRARRSRVGIASVAFVAVIVACGGTAPHVTRVETTRRPQVPAVVETARAVAQVEQVSLLVRGLEAERLGGYLAAVAADEAARARVVVQSAPTPATRTSGPRSLAWWQAIATCESGWPNAGPENTWRTGYFGLEASYPIGHLSWDEQLAWAMDIYSRAGDGAWGCSGRAWQTVPAG